VNDLTRSAPLRKRVNLLVGLGALLALSLFSEAKAAAPSATPSDALPIDLQWEGPASCPVSEDIQRDVRRFLGDAPLPATLPTIAVRVTVRPKDDGGFDVRIVTTTAGDTRERLLGTQTCDEARNLAALLLALLIDPRAQQPAPNPPPPTAKPPAAPPPRAPAPRPQPEREPAVRWLVGVSASAALGILPGGTVGGELRTGFLSSGWSLEGTGGAWLPRQTESPDVPGAMGRFTLFDAGLLGCFRGALGESVSLQACAGPILLVMHGEGSGVRDPGQDDALFVSVSAEGAVLIAISRRLSLRPGLGALVPLRRPTFAIHDVGTIHRPSAVIARAFLGLEAQF